MRRYVYSLILLIIIYYSCSTKTQINTYSAYFDSNPWYLKRSVLGVALKYVDSKITIDDVFYGAKETGLKPGDIIIQIDDYSVNKRIDVINFLKNKKPGENVIVKISRNGDNIEYIVTLELRYFHWIQEKLMSLIWTEERINLVTIQGEIINTSIDSSQQFEKWKNTIWSSLVNKIENDFIRIFEDNPNFTYINNDNLNKLSNKIQNIENKTLSQITIDNLIKSLDVTHILQFDYYQSKNNNKKKYSLIEAKTGRIIDKIVINK